MNPYYERIMALKEADEFKKVVLSVYSDKKEKLHNLTAFLSMYLRIEQVSLSLPKTADLFEYIERNLGAYGLSLSEDAKEFGLIDHVITDEA